MNCGDFLREPIKSGCAFAGICLLGGGILALGIAAGIAVRIFS
jgi:hypothetical protein